MESVKPASPTRSSGDAVPAYLLGFVLIGMGLTVAGPGLSHLRDRMHTDDGGIAWIFVGGSLGYILGSVFAGRGLDHGDGHRRWSVAMAVITAGMLLVAAAPNLLLLVLAFAVMGMACGLSDVSGNTLVMWSRPQGAGRLLNALHLCFAVGAVCAPLFVNRSIHWFNSLWGMAVPVGLLAAVSSFLMLRHEPPRRTRLDTLERSNAGGARTMHVVLVCGFFFAYVALETGFAGWIHTYVEQIHYGDATTATAIVTIFWFGFMLGRVAAIWLAAAMSPGWMVAVSMVVSVAASVLFFVFRGPGPMLWVVTFLFAVSIAPQYASMMAFAESHLALSGRNTAAFVGASGVGGLLMPWGLGQLFDAVGPETLPPVMVVTALATSGIAFAAGRALLRADQRPPVTSMNEPVT
jgi:MFS transporter, FHS family, Na+ dependent glucose transporter 1